MDLKKKILAAVMILLLVPAVVFAGGQGEKASGKKTIHDFDMVRFLSGSEVDTVFASGCVLVDKAIGDAGDIDTAVITMEMKNGTLAVIDNSRKALYGYDQRAEVFGSLRAAETGNDTLNTAVLSTAGGVANQKPLFFFLERYEQAFVDEMKSFINALQTGEPVPVTGMDVLIPVLIAQAAMKSFSSGKKKSFITHKKFPLSIS